MRIFFDTEFIDDGKTIDLISIGLVSEHGDEYYAESVECDHSRASQWVTENVLPHLQWGPSRRKSRAKIAAEVRDFVGNKPEFWAYFASYDWVVLCQLYGTMMDLPKGWPMWCRDICQLSSSLGNPSLPLQDGVEHNALADARANARHWKYLTDRG